MLEQLAGCDYDHWVLDNGSVDGTPEWLTGWADNTKRRYVVFSPENIGISPALNILLDNALNNGADVIVKVDNDCEAVTPGVLKAVAEMTHATGWILSPHINGLRNKPQGIGKIGNVTETALVGGIFLAATAEFYSDWRFDESAPIWGTDDTSLCERARSQHRAVGYLDGYEANHFETTDGQHERYPGYFIRRQAEGGPA